MRIARELVKTVTLPVLVSAGLGASALGLMMLLLGRGLNWFVMRHNQGKMPVDCLRLPLRVPREQYVRMEPSTRLKFLGDWIYRKSVRREASGGSVTIKTTVESPGDVLMDWGYSLVWLGRKCLLLWS